MEVVIRCESGVFRPSRGPLPVNLVREPAAGRVDTRCNERRICAYHNQGWYLTLFQGQHPPGTNPEGAANGRASYDPKTHRQDGELRD
jgi:hypothetical protein